jgi:aspartate/methionine/tyrosine aminotransferase
MQRAAISLLNKDDTLRETAAIRETFAPKRRSLLQGLKRIGVGFDLEPEGTFYCWGDLSNLPPSLRDGEDFFRAALAEKVITVPGVFFDVDPGKRRGARPSRFRNHARFSFGPSTRVLETAVQRLQALVERG